MKKKYIYSFYPYLPNISIFCFFFFIYLFSSYLIKINIQDRLANWKNNVFQNYSWNNLMFKIIYYIIIYFICIIELKLYSWNFFFFFTQEQNLSRVFKDLVLVIILFIVFYVTIKRIIWDRFLDWNDKLSLRLHNSIYTRNFSLVLLDTPRHVSS